MLGSLAHRLRRALGIERALKQRDEQLKLLTRLAEISERIEEQQYSPLQAEAAGWLESRVLGPLETLARVRAERLSLARFGDGEFATMLNHSQKLAFQRPTPGLRRDLRDVLRLEGYAGVPLLVGLPRALVGQAHWRRVWGKYWPWLKQVLRDDISYADAFVSREYFLREYGPEAIGAWRAVWNGETICVLTGQGSRFTPVAELFSNAASMQFIYSTPVDAYDDLPRLIDQVRTELPKSTLCLIALGPAGTVLAAKLAREGYWALDVGHLPNAYDKVHRRGPRPEALPIAR